MISVTCEICSKKFAVIPIRKKTAKYCSNNCRLKALHKQITGSGHGKFKNKTQRIKICLGCGIEMNWWTDYRKMAISKFIEMKFCSKQCADEHGFRYEGKEHPNYKEDSRRKERRGKHGSWRKKVLSRDKYICQKCGKKGRDKNVILHAHHIKHFKNNPKLRFEVDNGITLCLDCHAKEHGYRNYADQIKKSIIVNNRLVKRIEKSCGYCGKKIFYVPSDLIITTGKNKGKLKENFYCNKKCMGKHYSIIRKGKNNPRVKANV